MMSANIIDINEIKAVAEHTTNGINNRLEYHGNTIYQYLEEIFTDNSLAQ